MAKRCRSCCTPAACGQICVTIRGCTDGYNGGNFPVPWATVGVTSAGGFSDSCTPVTSISSFTMKAGGSGYTNTATAAITGTGGSLATAAVFVAGGSVVAINLTGAGGGFTGASATGATVTISGGGGSGATATATLLPTTVASFAVSAAGSGFTTTPTVTVAPPTSGTTATGRAILTGTTINTSITLVGGGSNYTTVPTVTFTPPTGQGGSGAAASARMKLTAAPVGFGGTGYTVGDSLTVVGGTSTTAATLTVTGASSGAITAATISDPGLYSALPTNNASASGGTGTGATFTLGWSVDSVVVSSAGTGYTAPPLITFSTGAASATCILTPTTLLNVVRVTAGSGYDAAPAVTITGGNGTGATATSALTGRGVASLAITAGGSGYASPTVTIGGGGGSGTTVGSRVTGGQVVQVVAVAGGSGYTSQPTAAISGGGGTGAKLTPKCTSTCCITTPADGSYTLTVAADRYTTSTTTVTISGCAVSNQTITLVVDGSHACVTPCWKPVAKTLFLTNALGTNTITNSGTNTWTGAVSFPGSVGRWNGTNVFCDVISSGNVFNTYALVFSVDASTFLPSLRFTNQVRVIECCQVGGGPGAAAVFAPDNVGSAGGVGSECGGSDTITSCSDPFAPSFSTTTSCLTDCGNTLSLSGGGSQALSE